MILLNFSVCDTRCVVVQISYQVVFTIQIPVLRLVYVEKAAPLQKSAILIVKKTL
jgi:hypothetical protein